MDPRNIVAMAFPSTLDLSGLEAALAEAALTPIGTVELQRNGFVPPTGEGALTYRIGDVAWICLGQQSRLLPPSVVEFEVEARRARAEAAGGLRPTGRALKQLRETVIVDLLPSAFVRHGRIDALIDAGRRLLLVDAASEADAEAVVAYLRLALGSFPATAQTAGVDPRDVMTAWISGVEPPPEGVALGDECELKESATDGAIVRYRRQELAGEEIKQHLEAGKRVSRLGLVVDGYLSCVVGEDLALRKLKRLEGAPEPDVGDHEDARAAAHARLALTVLELGRLLDLVAHAFGVAAPSAPPAPA